MDSMTAADFFARFGEVWVTGKVDTVDDLMPADVDYHLPPFPDMDRDGLKGFIGAFCRAFPDFTLTVDETVTEGDTSTHLWRCRATYSGDSPMFPVPPTGMATDGSGTHVIYWSGGRPVEIWHHGDWLGWLQKCGVVPPLG